MESEMVPEGRLSPSQAALALRRLLIDTAQEMRGGSVPSPATMALRIDGYALALEQLQHRLSDNEDLRPTLIAAYATLYGGDGNLTQRTERAGRILRDALE